MNVSLDAWRHMLSRSPMGWRPFGRQIFSQEGEDAVLSRIFADQESGFYVDIGAHHPLRFSNTYWAYRRGWSGINVDATPGFDVSFRRWRRRDKNITAFVSQKEGRRTLTVYSEKALNTGEDSRVKELQSRRGLVGHAISVPALQLQTILERYLPPQTPLDLLSVDVEGSELDVLESNDWNRFRPRVVVIEALGSTLATIGEAESVSFLVDRGYTPVSMMYHSVIAIADPALLAEH